MYSSMIRPCKLSVHSSSVGIFQILHHGFIETLHWLPSLCRVGGGQVVFSSMLPQYHCTCWLCLGWRLHTAAVWQSQPLISPLPSTVPALYSSFWLSPLLTQHITKKKEIKKWRNKDLIPGSRLNQSFRPTLMIPAWNGPFFLQNYAFRKIPCFFCHLSEYRPETLRHMRLESQISGCLNTGTVLAWWRTRGRVSWENIITWRSSRAGSSSHGHSARLVKWSAFLSLSIWYLVFWRKYF